jgi:hypothetical protein
VTGATALIRSKGLIQVELTPDVDTGTEILERNMNGTICVNEKDCPVIKGFNGKLKLCAVDPAILEMTVGVSPIVNPLVNTEFIGGSLRGESRSQCNKFALKVWGKQAIGCGSSSDPYVVFGLPQCDNAVLSSTITFANKQHQAWEIDFYACEGHDDFSDPTDVFLDVDQQGKVLAWKTAATIPTETNCGAYGPLA